MKYIDDQYRNPNINNRDHLVGQLTKRLVMMMMMIMMLIMMMVIMVMIIEVPELLWLLCLDATGRGSEVLLEFRDDADDNPEN